MAIAFVVGQIGGALAVSSVSEVWPFGPSQGVFLILVHQRVVGATPNVPTMTMNGSATVRMGTSTHVGPGTARHRLSVFRAPTYAAGLQANTMGITFGGQTQDNIVYRWLAVQGTVLVNPICRQLIFAEASNAMSVSATMGVGLSAASRCLGTAQGEIDGDPLGPLFALPPPEPEEGWLIHDGPYGSAPMGAIVVENPTAFDRTLALTPIPGPADALMAVMEWHETAATASGEIDGTHRTTVRVSGRND